MEEIEKALRNTQRKLASELGSAKRDRGFAFGSQVAQLNEKGT